ncbi:hypothetical protein [Prochlorococcus marinus]|uniref:hypothetical protein n=1 Tax=Prochlorococcus marinus TaxID=1219 RepID=UPI001ADD39A2|nr:hypothetical protein [Prochlorococcus marinus]MBO8204966.1 hypothetical protein [Prochlorococcus marinus CUG1415]MBW3044239.1 hypothetical protein [Prochlorococcus marinus str. MU1415]
MNEQGVYEIIYKSIDEINKTLDKNEKIPLVPDVELIGINGMLDSMDFATFIITLENKIHEKYNMQIDLLEESLIRNEDMKDLNSPNSINNLIRKIIDKKP